MKKKRMLQKNYNFSFRSLLVYKVLFVLLKVFHSYTTQTYSSRSQ